MWLYICAAIAIASAAGSWQVQNWRYAAKEKDRIEAIARDKMRAEKNIDTAAVGFESDKVRIRKVFVPITQEVERVVEKPVYRNICVDDDGLRLISTAIIGTNTAGQPAPTVPAPRPAR